MEKNYCYYAIAAIQSGKISAKLKKELFEWEEAEQRYKEIVEQVNKVFEIEEDLSDEERAELFSAFDDAIYNIAFARYVDEDYSGAIDLLTSAKPDLLKAKILLGTLLNRLASKGHGVDYFVKSAPLLGILEQQEEQVWQEDIDSMDDMMLGGAYLFLSMLYRYGFGVKKDLHHAFEILQRGLQRVEDEGRRELLTQEMSHYKKGFFGGWEYR